MYEGIVIFGFWVHFYLSKNYIFYELNDFFILIIGSPMYKQISINRIFFYKIVNSLNNRFSSTHTAQPD